MVLEPERCPSEPPRLSPGVPFPSMASFAEIFEDYAEIQRLFEKKNPREASRVFYVVNLLEEAGELAEVIKSEDFYGVEPEEILEEEIADIFYSLVGICRHSGVDMEAALRRRAKALRARALSEEI